MNHVHSLMNLDEHCPECGSLLVRIPGSTLCPHCGFEDEDPEERVSASLIQLPGRWGEGARFRLFDEAA